MEADHYEIVETEAFLKVKKHYSRKYQSVPKDVELFKKVLLARPDDGNTLLANSNPATRYLRKSRMACTSLGRGQSGSFRVFYIQDTTARTLTLLIFALRSEEHDVDYAKLGAILKGMQ